MRNYEHERTFSIFHVVRTSDKNRRKFFLVLHKLLEYIKRYLTIACLECYSLFLVILDSTRHQLKTYLIKSQFRKTLSLSDQIQKSLQSIYGSISVIVFGFIKHDTSYRLHNVLWKIVKETVIYLQNKFVKKYQFVFHECSNELMNGGIVTVINK